MQQWLASPETEAKTGNFTQTTWLPAGPQGLSCTFPCCTPWGSSQPTSPSCPGPSGESATPPILYSWRSESERRQTDKSRKVCAYQESSKNGKRFWVCISWHLTSTRLHSQATWTFWDDSVRSSACCSRHPWPYLKPNAFTLWRVVE